MKSTTIVAVKYINTLPFIFGIQNGNLPFKYRLLLKSPSACAKILFNHRANIGLVPVAALSELSDYHIITSYCLGAIQKVRSVCLFSDVPLEKIKKIILDPQSRTSVLLVKLLAKNYWNINPEWILGKSGFENEIKNLTAGVIIGDRAFQFEKKFKYKFDLATHWYRFTKLPFVFACWVAKKNTETEILSMFNNALQFGIDNREKAIELYSVNLINKKEIRNYLKEDISYELDDLKRQGMKLFMEMIRKHSIV